MVINGSKKSNTVSTPILPTDKQQKKKKRTHAFDIYLIIIIYLSIIEKVRVQVLGITRGP